MIETSALTTEQKARILALAEAIEAGARLHPQGSKFYWSPVGYPVYDIDPAAITWATCAFGAAWEATHEDFDVTNENHRHSISAMDMLNFFDVRGVHVRSPIGTFSNRSLYDLIIGLNDEAGWSREDIAEWLKSLVR